MHAAPAREYNGDEEGWCEGRAGVKGEKLMLQGPMDLRHHVGIETNTRGVGGGLGLTIV